MLSLVCHMTCHDDFTWSVMMSHTCHYIVTSHDLSQCCHVTCHNVVTWHVTVCSHNMSQCCHMTCHSVVTDLSLCCHVVCHNVVTWLVMMFSHGLQSRCHMVCHDVTWPSLSHDLPVTCLSHGAMLLYSWRVTYLSDMVFGRALLLATLCDGKMPIISKILIDQHVNIKFKWFL